jgi:hypothetical protein
MIAIQIKKKSWVHYLYKVMSNQAYYMRFKKEIIYLWNDDAQCYVKSTPKNGYFAKYPGKPEFKIDASSNTVVMAIDGKREVKASEYDNA